MSSTATHQTSRRPFGARRAAAAPAAVVAPAGNGPGKLALSK